MSVKRQILFWLIALILLLGIVFLLGSTLTPFAAGMVLAYLLDPLVDKLKSWGFGRLGATLLIMGLFIVVFVLLLVTLVPLVAHQMASFLSALPSYIVKIQTLVLEVTQPWLDKWYGDVPPPDLQASAKGLVGQGATWFGSFLKSLWSGGQALISVVSLIIITPIVAFYLLLDWSDMVTTLDSWLPRRHRDTIRSLCRDIDRAVAGCIRGQASVCLLLGSYYAIGLSLIGLNFGALIGLIAGVLSFIPYVGSAIGMILALGIALSQFWPEWTMVILTAVVFGTGQFLEGNFLSPKIIGQSAGLHPVWLMFALLAFGGLFGFVGLLIAVPLAAASGVLTRFALKQYLASPLYSDGFEMPLDSPDIEIAEDVVVNVAAVPPEVKNAG